MKNQHTPGPWRIVCASAHEFNPDTLRKDIIGKCQFGDAYVAGDISINDAHLIAAAPKLLQVLKDLLPEFVDLYERFDPTGEIAVWDQWTQEALEVIAEAEGVK